MGVAALLMASDRCSTLWCSTLTNGRRWRSAVTKKSSASTTTWGRGPARAYTHASAQSCLCGIDHPHPAVIAWNESSLLGSNNLLLCAVANACRVQLRVSRESFLGPRETGNPSSYSFPVLSDANKLCVGS